MDSSIQNVATGDSTNVFSGAPADLGIPSPTLHVFHAADMGHFVYFTLAGSIARVDPKWAYALQQLEQGQETAESLLAKAANEGDTLFAETLSRLMAEGFIPTIQSSVRERESISATRLLGHSPRNLMLLVTNACNLKCAYCYELNQGVHTVGKNMDVSVARTAIEQYFRESGSRSDVTITFFGGEPLINSSLIRDLVLFADTRAKDIGKSVAFTMTTNLTLMTEQMADFLVAHRFTFMVSIDGNEADHDRYRVNQKGDGTHRTVVSNLRMLSSKLLAAGLRLPKLRATLTPKSADRDDVYAYLESLECASVEIGSVETDPADPSGKTPYKVDQATIRGIWDDAARAISTHPGHPSKHVTPLMKKELLRMKGKLASSMALTATAPALCGVCRNMKAISATGDIYPCHRYVGMDEFKMGSVAFGGADEERVGNYYGKLQASLGESCSKCWAHVLCGGFCPWTLSAEDGTVRPPDEADCREMRLALESKLRLYASCVESEMAHEIGTRK